MNALYLHTVVAKLGSPLGVALLLMGPVAIIVTALLSPSDVGAAAGAASSLAIVLAAFVFAAGVLGQPIQSGEMINWITRPVTLPAILLARFAGVLTAAVVVGVTPLVLALPFGSGVDLPTLLQGLSTAFALVATISFLSCLLPGYGDAVVAMLAIILLGILQGALLPLAPWLHWPVEILARIVGSRADGMLEVLVRPTMASARALAFGLFRIAALLTVGAFILTRRDFGYGRG